MSYCDAVLQLYLAQKNKVGPYYLVRADPP